jgi:hypothetical protein
MYPAAQTGRTFYIDYVNGSNANSGTSRSSAWKTHPYMQNASACTSTGAGPSYSHAPGDRFVFKGGVSWPASCFPVVISSGGSSSTVRDTYGTEPSWFNGSSFSKPKFDGQGVSLNTMVRIRASNITFDNFDITNWKILISGLCSGGINIENVSNVLISNLYLHDWIASGKQNLSGHDYGGVIGCSYNTIRQNVWLTDSEVEDDVLAPNWMGACFRKISADRVNCHHLTEGVVDLGIVRNSEFHHITMGGLTYDSGGAHTNIIENEGNSEGAIYNNLFHDNKGGVNFLTCNNITIYNNVFWNNQWNNEIFIDTNCGSLSTSTSNVYNNTVACNPNFSCFAIEERGLGRLGNLNLRNNLWITTGSTVDLGPGVVNNNSSNNIKLTPTQAASLGYTAANKYQPIADSSPTVDAGANLTSVCAGLDTAGYPFTPLCKDVLGMARPTSGPWDVGAYQFGGWLAAPAAPSNVRVIR